MKSLMNAFFTGLALLTVFCQCSTVIDGPVQPQEKAEQELPEFRFPDEFDFSTKKEITLHLATTDDAGKYQISYDWLGEAAALGTFNAQKKSKPIQLEVPANVQTINVQLVNAEGSQTRQFNIASQETIEVSFPNDMGRTDAGCQDRLYAVENSFGGFWEIDLQQDGYQESQLPNLSGGGSIACALDQENGYMYYNVGRTLYRYDVNQETFETVFNSNPFNGSYPRFEYRDGFFYMSNGRTLYKVDASTNEVMIQYDISGFVNNNSGGDLAFASDGTLYLACFSGLYRFTSFDDDQGTANITRISAENFPYQLTSMAIDRKDHIYVGTNESQSRLLRMNIEDGSFEQVAVYNHKINDLTAWKCAEEDLEDIDTDGDGVIDELDDYPEDAEISFTQYTPSELGQGSLAFEDMWPDVGDYDFNDLVLRYKYIQYINAENRSVRMKMIFDLVAMGATFHNGFGIELPTDPSYIEQVTGFEINGSGINLTEKGLEAGQTNPVIIVFDDAFDHLGGNAIVNTKSDGASAPHKRFEIMVEFVEPLELSELRTQFFNPFIFIEDRSKELHLRNKPPTDLANQAFLGTGSDRSAPGSNEYYRSPANAPWAIDIIHAFRYPKEASRIDRAYNRFMEWANSEGAQYPDWYTDANGNRNQAHLYD